MKTTALILKAYDALHVLDNNSWTNHREELYRLCREEEKGHRGFASGFDKYHPGAPSIATMAKMFAVRRIAEYLLGEKFPSGATYLHCQKSIFYAAGLVDEFRAQIETAWTGLDVAQLAALDYTSFVKVQTPAIA